MPLKVYLDPLSQPCRAVMLLLEANKVKYEKVLLQLGKGEHRKCEELKKINPDTTIPTMDDDGFVLCESATIMTYLVDKYHLSDHWYPKDLQKRAKVDQYLHWHHNNLRRGGAVFYFKYIHPIFKGCEAEPALLSASEDTLKKALAKLNDYYLKDSKFIYGEEISVADLQALCELTESWTVEIKYEDDYPNLKRWVADCQKELGETFEEVYQTVYQIRDSKALMGEKKA